jgi:hypothetical protein
MRVRVLSYLILKSERDLTPIITLPTLKGVDIISLLLLLFSLDIHEYKGYFPNIFRNFFRSTNIYYGSC